MHRLFFSIFLHRDSSHLLVNVLLKILLDSLYQLHGVQIISLFLVSAILNLIACIRDQEILIVGCSGYLSLMLGFQINKVRGAKRLINRAIILLVICNIFLTN
jgi:membrane associated rhomboid family serine protease